jgi:hypothetical protein
MTKSSKSSNSRNKSPANYYENGYIVFSNIFRKTINKDVKEAGKFWRWLSNESKNEYIRHANTRRILKNYFGKNYKNINFKPAAKKGSRTFNIIFDDLCQNTIINEHYRKILPKVAPQSSLSKEPSEEEYFEIFDNYIDYE